MKGYLHVHWVAEAVKELWSAPKPGKIEASPITSSLGGRGWAPIESAIKEGSVFTFRQKNSILIKKLGSIWTSPEAVMARAKSKATNGLSFLIDIRRHDDDWDTPPALRKSDRGREENL